MINNRTEIVTPSPARILFFLGLNRSASVVSFFLFRFFLLLSFFKLFFLVVPSPVRSVEGFLTVAMVTGGTLIEKKWNNDVDYESIS